MPAISSPRPATYAVTRRFIQDRSARICVMGLGRVGLPLAIRFSQAGFSVHGFDLNSAITNRLRIHKHYHWLTKFDKTRLARRAEFDVMGDLSRIAETEVLVLCPPMIQREPIALDLQLIRETIFDVATYIHGGHLIVVECPFNPAITEEVVVPLLESANGAHLNVSRGTGAPDEIFVSISPRGDDSDPFHAKSAEGVRLVGGVDRLGMELILELYSTIFRKVIPIPCPSRAEAITLLKWANQHPGVSSKFTTQLQKLCRCVCDGEEVYAQASQLPVSRAFEQLYDQIRNAEIPIDPFYFAWKESESGFHFRPLE